MTFFTYTLSWLGSDGGEADQRLHLRVRRSSTTHCLNESSSSLHNSLAGPPGEVSLQQMAFHFPSLPVRSLLWVHAEGSAFDEAVLLSQGKPRPPLRAAHYHRDPGLDPGAEGHLACVGGS